MKIDYEPNEEYLRGCIRSCQEKGHIQQVAFSTYHDTITQICFSCNVVRTSLNDAERKGSKKNIPLTHFKQKIQALNKQKQKT